MNKLKSWVPLSVVPIAAVAVAVGVWESSEVILESKFNSSWKYNQMLDKKSGVEVKGKFDLIIYRGV